MLALMHILSKKRGWTLFNMLRSAFTMAAGVVLGLITIMASDPWGEVYANFITTAWVLPIIVIVYFIVMIVTHLPHPPHASWHNRLRYSRYQVMDESLEMNRVKTGPPPSPSLSPSPLLSPEPSREGHAGAS
jgi:hypothetical protein